jgi:predicted nucleic acid-binding Zn ribbon protein
VRPRRRSTPRPLGDLVPRVLDELGFERANALARLSERWEAIVGPEAARHCRPTGLRGPVLEATAESSAWCQQLQLHREEILTALARELGDEAPTHLWLRVG